MPDGHASRPGDAELLIAVRSFAVAVVGALLATIASVTSAPLVLAVAYLLWLMTVLAVARGVLAGSIGLWRRTHGPGDRG